MFPVKRITIKGRRFELRCVRMKTCYGQCDHPNSVRPEIRINSRLKGGVKLMDTLIHESLHASNWDLSEEFVTQFAEDMSRILWRLGYRGPGDHQQS